MIGLVALAIYAASIPAANWMIGHVGHCLPSGPCVLPVGFGLTAPSGVLMVGIALVARDAVQSLLGLRIALLAVVVGIVLSFWLATPDVALASAVAFGLSEIADTLVYSPLRKRHLTLALLASVAVGAAVDSVAFLWIAFHSFDFIAGQIVGKFWAAIAAAILLTLFRRRMSLQAANR
jgi:uncharacterized PurR-regulated membrane protein YhhQ (DUF165 family)